MINSGALQRIVRASIESGTFALGRQRASPRVETFTQWLKERGNAG